MKPVTISLIFLCICIQGKTTPAPTEGVVIPFTLNTQGHIMIHARFNGIEGNFIFDTGAGLNLVTKKFADRMQGLTPEDGYYTGFRAIGERMDMKMYQAKELSIGNWKIANPQLTWFDANWGDIDGIIALKNFEKDVILIIDYSASTLTIAPKSSFAALKKSATGTFPIQLEQIRGISLDMFVYVRINQGPVLQFSMDSGSGKDILRINQKLIGALHIDTTDQSKVQKTVQQSEFKAEFSNVIYNANISQLAIDAAPKINWQQPKAQFVDGLIYDGIMSINWMGKKIAISVPDQEIAVWR